MPSTQLKVSKAGVSQAISPGQGRRCCPQVSDALGHSLEHEAAGERDGQQNLITTRHTDGQLSLGPGGERPEALPQDWPQTPAKLGF